MLWRCLAAPGWGAHAVAGTLQKQLSISLVLDGLSGCSSGRRCGGSRRCCGGGAGRAVAGGCRRFGLGGSGLGGRHSGLGRVVVHIPAGAPEVEGRRGQGALQYPLAHGPPKLVFGREVLDFFKAVATFGASVRIQRQSHSPLREEITHCAYCTGRAVKACKTRRPAASWSRNAGSHCTEMGTYPPRFSQTRVSVPLLPVKSLIVYFRFSTSAGGFSMVILTWPRSCDLSYFSPHWPVCLLTIRTQLAGSEMSTNRV